MFGKLMLTVTIKLPQTALDPVANHGIAAGFGHYKSSHAGFSRPDHVIADQISTCLSLAFRFDALEIQSRSQNAGAWQAAIRLGCDGQTCGPFPWG